MRHLSHCLILALPVLLAIPSWACAHAVECADEPQVRILAGPDSKARVEWFETNQLPAVTTFLRAAREAVAHLPKKVTFVLPSDADKQDRASLDWLYGKDYPEKAKALLAATATVDLRTLAARREFLKKFACEFPGLIEASKLPLAHFPSISAFLEPDALRQWSQRALENLLDAKAKPLGISIVFRKTGMGYSLSDFPGSECALIAFGENWSGGPNGHGEERNLHTVLHELGHWIDASTLPVFDEARLPTEATNEALADLIATLYLQTPSYSNDKRRMDLPMSLEGLEKNLEVLGDEYRLAQPVRFAAWEKLHGLPYAKALPRLLEVRDRVLVNGPGIDPHLVLNPKSISKDIRHDWSLAELRQVIAPFVEEMSKTP